MALDEFALAKKDAAKTASNMILRNIFYVTPKFEVERLLPFAVYERFRENVYAKLIFFSNGTGFCLAGDLERKTRKLVGKLV